MGDPCVFVPFPRFAHPVFCILYMCLLFGSLDSGIFGGGGLEIIPSGRFFS